MHYIPGALHMHTTYSDGSGSVEDLARAARAAGLRWIIITDHDTLTGQRYQGWLDSPLTPEGIAQAGANSVLFRMAQHSAWVNMIRILHDSLGEPAARLTWKEFGADSIDYYEAKARAHWLEPSHARAYFDSLAAWAAPRARTATQDPGYQLELAYALAGAGRRAEAARAIRPLIDGRQFRVSGWSLAKLAQTYVMIGDYGRAVEYVGRALVEAPEYTPAIFRLDPIWDPLRGRADFSKLVAKR